MVEREIKLHVAGRRVDEVADVLGSVGIRVGSPNFQHDTVYASSRGDLLSPQRGTTVSRVREDSTGPTITVKQRRDSDLDRAEIELRVDSAPMAGAVLQLLGLDAIVIVRKVRHAALSMGDLEDEKTRLELVIDEVEGLGVFVEIEAMGHEGDDLAPALERAATAVADLLGPGTTRIDKGYDRLLLEAADEALPDGKP